MRIPEFTRTVLPDRSVGIARAQVARAPYDQKAEAMGQLRQGVKQVENAAADYMYREANARNATWVNEKAIEYKKELLDNLDGERQTRNKNPENFHKDFDSVMQKKADEYIKSAPSEAARESFRQTASEIRGGVYDNNLKWERERKVEMFGASVEKAGQDLASMAYRAGQRGESVTDLYRDADASAVAGSTFVAPEKVQQIQDTLHSTIAEAELAGKIEAKPEEAIKEINRGRYSGVQGSFEDAAAFIAEEEGGFVSDDGGKGPTLYGVNSEANKKEYGEIKALYDAGKVDEAQAMAKQVFKEKYWDAIGADNLPPKLAMVAMDAAVNQGVGAAQKMLKEAGGDVDAFIELRRERYQKTAKLPGKGQFLNTWLRRLDNLKAEINSPGLPPEKLMQFKNRAKAAVQVEIHDEIQDIETAAKMGVEIEAGKLESVIKKTSAVGMKKEAQELREFAALQPEIKRFSSESLVDQRKEIIALKAQVEAGNLGEAKKYAALSTVLENKQKMIEGGEALAYYAAHKVIQEPQPIDFSSAEGMKGEIDKRRRAAQQIKDLDGLQVSLFTGSEIKMLKDIYDNSDAKQMTQLLTSMGESMNGAEISALSRAVAPKSSTLAVAIAANDPIVAERIMQGAKLESDVKQADIRPLVTELLSSAITDPGKFESIQDAVYANYKMLSFMAGDKAMTVNSDRLNKALQDIVGPVAEIDTRTGFGGAAKVLTYKDGGQWKDEDDLNDILNSLTDENLKQFGAPVGTLGRKYRAKDIYASGRFVSDGDGVYAVLDAFGDVVKNEDGTTFRVDARKLDKLRKQ